MNRQVVNSLMIGMLLAANASAFASDQESPQGLEQWQQPWRGHAGGEPRYAETWQGAGIGAIAGAIIGGPPGFIAGAAGGVLAGHNRGLEADLQSTKQEVKRLSRQEQSKSERLQDLTRQLAAARSDYQQRLQAIARGFTQRIHFRTGKTLLEPEAQQDLVELAAMLQTQREWHVVLHAHADRRGTQAANQALSAARAEAVSQQLILHGVAAARISREVHGESDARYPAEDREGLVYDRQVVISLRTGGAS